MERDFEGLVEPARDPHEEPETEPEARVPAPVEDRDDEQVELRLPEEREELHRRLEPCRLGLERLDQGDLDVRHTLPAKVDVRKELGHRLRDPADDELDGDRKDDDRHQFRDDPQSSLPDEGKDPRTVEHPDEGEAEGRDDQRNRDQGKPHEPGDLCHQAYHLESPHSRAMKAYGTRTHKTVFKGDRQAACRDENLNTLKIHWCIIKKIKRRNIHLEKIPKREFVSILS